MRTPPSRTCLGCRRTRSKDRLVRLVRLASGTVVVDPGARAGGRGAYVCPDSACVEQALVRGRLARAFRKPCAVEPNLVATVRVVGGKEDVRPDEVGAESDVCSGVVGARV
jgi:predicted RNA-binding protein YlxR (DUF448 family)